MSGEDIRKKYGADLMSVTVAEAANIALRTVISVLLARALDVSGRGEYALAFLIPGIFLSFTSFGLGEASATLIGKKEFPAAEVAGGLNIFLVLLTAAVALVYFPLGETMLELSGKALPAALYALGFSLIPLTFFWGNNASVLLGLGRVREVGWGRVGNNAVFLVAAGAFALYGEGLTVKSALGVFIISGTLEVLYLLYFVRRDAGLVPVFRREIFRRQWAFGLKFFAGTVFNQLTRRLDAYIVFFFLGSKGLGLYVVAVGLAEFLLAVPTVFSRLVFSVSARSAAGSGDGELFSASVRQTFQALAVSSLCLFAVLGPAIELLYGSNFSEAFLPCALLLPGIIALGVSVVMGYIFMGQNMPAKVARGAFISCAFTVVLDIALIPAYGVPGASAASSLSYLAGMVYLTRVYCRRFSASVGELFLPRAEDLAFWKGVVKGLAGKAVRS